MWRQRYREGRVFSPPSLFRALQHDESDGLTITFTPDFDIFEDVQFDYDTLAKRCKHLAAFIQGLRINLIDERIGQYRSETFYSEDGLASLVTEMSKGRNVVSSIITGIADAPLSMGVRYDQAGNELEEIVRFRAEFAIQFTHSSEETVSSFCNTISTPEHGTHVEGLRQGIKDFLRTYSDDKVMKNAQLSYVGVISVFHPEPLYEGRVKLKILGSEILSAVREVVRNTLHQQLDNAHDVIQQSISTVD